MSSAMIESDCEQPIGKNENGRENILNDEELEILTAQERQFYENMTQEVIDEYREVYNIYDVEQEGAISDKQITEVMRHCGQSPSDEEVAEVVKKIDVDGSGLIEFNEFVILMVIQSCKESLVEEELVEIFKIFDKDGDGKISVHDLMAQFVKLGDPIQESDAKKMIKHCDIDNDGAFNFTEFLKVMMYNTEDKAIDDPSFSSKK